MLRCVACHKFLQNLFLFCTFLKFFFFLIRTTTILSKQFCPSCGYKTLERIVEVINQFGEKTYVGRRKPKSTKGLRVIFRILNKKSFF